jgi:hypothetical protein
MSTGYPKISRDQKIPGLNNPGILKPEKSRNKKSRDFECIKIPGFLNESWDIPAGFFPSFYDILSEMLLNFHISMKIWLYIQMKFPCFVMET